MANLEWIDKESKEQDESSRKSEIVFEASFKGFGQDKDS